VGPVFRRDPHPEVLLSNAYLNSLELAAAHKLKTVAFPSISTGAYGYPIKEAAAIAVATINRHLSVNAYPETVFLVAHSDADFAIITGAVDNYGD